MQPTAILEANVDPIANALVDDRGDADTAGPSKRLQAHRDVDAIAVAVVVFNDASPRLIPIRSTMIGWGALAPSSAAPEPCTERAHFTASTTLPNSTLT